jgi:Holliday junction DNA helicase RuvA|tara:strand:- start:35 stop:616 length:582 start_codon:yes stop_codon:yes gene_type:complete
MITQIQGKLIEKNPTNVVVECSGVCYEINISMHTFSLLPTSDFLKIYTHLQVKEDSHTLYGFIEKAERELFRLLISVSGIGTNTARVMLSSLSPKQIQQAIAVADVATIQSIKGIGAKTAQRVILDLKEKVLKVFGIDEVSSALNNTNKEEALSALEVLGYARKQADKVCSKIVGSSPDASVETIIKLALKSL